MIYDCFLFLNELDLLEIRLNVLDSVVDKFVIVEATKTFTNKDKPLFFEQHRNRFHPFEHKIIYIKVDSFPVFCTAWTFENYQRNMIMEGLKECKDNDIIIISDLDEIPNPKAIEEYNEIDIRVLEQKMYSCFLNYRCLIYKRWHGARIMRYANITNTNVNNYKFEYSNMLLSDQNTGLTPMKIRFIENLPIIKNGGWHFTYLGGIEQIRYKLQSFSHQEKNTPEYNDEKVLQKKISKGIDIVHPKDNRCIPVKIDTSYPEFIRHNIYKYQHLIWPLPKYSIIRNFQICVITYIYYYCIRKPIKFLRSMIKIIINVVIRFV